MLDTVVISGEDGCCSVVFGTLVGVFVCSVMRSELLMTSAISCPLWSSVYACHKVECAFTSPVRYVGSYFLIQEFENWITGVCSSYVVSLCDFAYYVFG